MNKIEEIKEYILSSILKIFKWNSITTICKRCLSRNLTSQYPKIPRKIHYTKWNCLNCGRVFYESSRILKRSPFK